MKPQKVDWKDQNNVVNAAKALGGGTFVFLIPGRGNYNIGFLSRWPEIQAKGGVMVWRPSNVQRA